MKKKFLCGAILMALTLNLVACGDGSEDSSASKHGEIMELVPEPSETSESAETNLDEVQSDNEPEAEADENGEKTAEDYRQLAEKYKGQGLIRKQRDMLEKSYRLYGDEEAFKTLQTIAVNLAEEDSAIQEQANLMLQNLELTEYLGESVNLISTQEWLNTMMPRLHEGNRNYFLQKDGQKVLFIQAGYSQAGEPVAKVWYWGEQVRVLRREGSTVQFLETGMTEDKYQGAFTSWTLDGSTGDIYQESGTFGNGVLTGDYKISIHEGTAGSDVFSLWNNKEGMNYTNYNGNFNEQGISTLQQPAANKIASLVSGSEYPSCIVYAIDVNDCLFEGLKEGEEAATYVFGIEKMGWESCPSFTVYEPVEDTEGNTEQANTDIQVRVFDGELQICQNGKWIGMGSVESYIQADPFRNYEYNRIENETPDGESATALGYQRIGGTIPKDKVTRPATQKPAQQPQQPTPAPQPEQPQQQPAPQPQQPTPQPSTPPADNNNSNNDNNSNETDIEWTPDFM